MVIATATGREYIQKERERVRKWRADRSAAGRDIGRLPPVADPARRRATVESFKRFCKTYFPRTFRLEFSGDHDKVIEIIENACDRGGLFAMAMPRGSGKTSLVIAAAIWAILTGRRRFVMLVGATATKAKELLRSIKTELRTNELLLADFPEAVYPIAALEGITNRAAGQRYRGQPTFISWTSDLIVMPTIPGSPASGAIISVAGILTASRGAQFKRPDGTTVRPDLIIPDDPQTDRSAKSAKQVNDREEVIKSGLLRSAGPGEKITMLCPCTVIQEDDLADRLTDRKKNPIFTGLKTKTLYSFPAAAELWERYAEIRDASYRAGHEGREANEFYAANRAAMDAGAVVAWAERVEAGDLSAIQTAMNAHLADPRGFAAEYQNEPINLAAAAEFATLSPAEVAAKVNNHERGQVPAFATILTAKIDVSQDVLWWTVAAWGPDFSGALVDYGAWPEQNRGYFTLTNLARTIADEIPEAASLEDQLYEAVTRCVDMLAARKFPRVDGSEMTIDAEALHVDAQWQTKTIKAACRNTRHAALVLPAHGRGVGAKDRPISEWRRADGQRYGEEWIIVRDAQLRGAKHLIYDANYWKTELHKRLKTPIGRPGSLALFGSSPTAHRMIADHLAAAEKPYLVEAKGRKAIEWELPPNKPDNHWLDCLAGCAMAASIRGANTLAGRKSDTPPRPASRRPRVSYVTD